MKKISIFFFLFCILFTPQAFATLGVGVSVGKIFVNQLLKPGQLYYLPPITVLNTGTESSEYHILIDHQQNQKELIPDQRWFTFSPQEFHLDSKKAQKVNIALNLPLNALPGQYFVYVEAQPIRKTETGTSAVNIAAATKLYFTIVPDTLIDGLYYKALSIWTITSPWPQVIIAAIFLITFMLLAKRFINIEIKMTKKHIPLWVLVTSVVIFFIIYLLFWLKIFHIL